MNDNDIKLIEASLKISLPTSYKTLILNHPCPDNQDICNHGLFNDAQHLIDENINHRTNGWFDMDWPDNFLLIGDDGCGDTYFMVLGKDEHVYFADHECGPSYQDDLDGCLSHETVTDHLENLLEIERELDREEKELAERRANKKWWQFWI